MTEILLKTSDAPSSEAHGTSVFLTVRSERTIDLGTSWLSNSFPVSSVSCLLHAVQWSGKLGPGIHSGPACSAQSALLGRPGLSPDCTLGRQNMSGM